MQPFKNRREAGRQLAHKLMPWAERKDIVVLALPRGGVPVGFEIAKTLHAPFDLMLVRKLGVPGEEELAMGALALPDVCVFNHDVIRGISVSQGNIEHVVAKEQRELLRRNKAYRGGEPPPALHDKIVFLVDDGVATGATMRAAIVVAKQEGAKQVIAAVPVIATEALPDLREMAEVEFLQAPRPFLGVGRFYTDFDQTTDEEVITLLHEARKWGKGQIDFSDNKKIVHA